MQTWVGKVEFKAGDQIEKFWKVVKKNSTRELVLFFAGVAILAKKLIKAEKIHFIPKVFYITFCVFLSF